MLVTKNGSISKKGVPLSSIEGRSRQLGHIFYFLNRHSLEEPIAQSQSFGRFKGAFYTSMGLFALKNSSTAKSG